MAIDITSVRKQPIIALYFESETVLQFHNLEARSYMENSSFVEFMILSIRYQKEMELVTFSRMIVLTGLDIITILLNLK